MKIYNSSISMLMGFLILSSITMITMSTSCKKSDSTTTSTSDWVVYDELTLGDQFSTSFGSFFKPQTGLAVSLSTASTEQPSIGLMFFTVQNGADYYLAFPAAASSLVDTSSNTLFSESTYGVDYWSASNLVTGIITPCSMSQSDFENLTSENSWSSFNQAFTTQNNNSANLSSGSKYVKNPAFGNVYLVQFNNLIRAIICLKSVISTSPYGGSLTLSALIEGKSSYESLAGAKYIMPSPSDGSSISPMPNCNLTTLFTDNFQRTNGSLGSNYIDTLIGGQGSYGIVNDSLKVTGPGSWFRLL